MRTEEGIQAFDLPKVVPHLSRQEGMYIQAAFRNLDVVIEPYRGGVSMTVSSRFENIDESVQVILSAGAPSVQASSAFLDTGRVAKGVMRLPKKLAMFIDVMEKDRNYARFYQPMKDFYLEEMNPKTLH